jgi:hypothetical protein
VIVLSNLEATPVSRIASDLAAIALGEAPESRQPTDKDDKPNDAAPKAEAKPKASSP